MYHGYTEGGTSAGLPAAISTDRNAFIAKFPPVPGFFGGTLRAKQVQVLSAYVSVLAGAVCLATFIDHPPVTAFSLGMMLPGGGFLTWASPLHPLQTVALGLFGFSVLAFLLSLVIWFATGNVILPAVLWIALAGASAAFPEGGPNAVWQSAIPIVPMALLCVVAISCSLVFLSWRRGLRHREELNRHLTTINETARVSSALATSDEPELGVRDLQLMRLVLDRALQPVEAFDGFEWLDQFQTAAVRYQVNFMSYALSIAQSVHLPAFSGYLDLAQRNLAAKQQDYRLWRYWRLENIWGNLSTDPDPVPRDNIMLTGFLAGQLAFHHKASPVQCFAPPQMLTFRHPSGAEFIYSEEDLLEVLCRSYETAKHGLLACEPNWIYPLCNLITVSAIRARHDTLAGARWTAIAPAFRKRLEEEFIASDGRLVPFRSNYVGLTGSHIGGAIMQAFPCFFLNAVFPDMARRQWEALNYDLAGRDWKKALWPIDIGNYGFSRAACYAATAAAATEVGDEEVAKLLLAKLDEDCPVSVSGGVAHRANASLWAHAVELVARCGAGDALQGLVRSLQKGLAQRPYIKDAPYPDVLVVSAHADDRSLRAVLRSGANGAFKRITIGGLVPDRPYIARMNEDIAFMSDGAGEAQLNLPLNGRLVLQVMPVE